MEQRKIRRKVAWEGIPALSLAPIFRKHPRMFFVLGDIDLQE